GEQRGVARGEVEPVQLREFVAALVLAEHETVQLRRRGRDGHAAERLRIERELLAHAHRLAHTVRLRGLGEARADQQAAVPGPAGEADTTRVLVAVEA